MAEQVDSTSTQPAMRESARPTEAFGMLGRLKMYLELIRFSHTIFALPFAALATVWSIAVPREFSSLAGGSILWRACGVVICMVAARSAAMAFNRLVDADIDARNPRTSRRHLPAGLLHRSSVWLFFGSTSLAFLLACGLFLPNWIPLAGALPVLAWICGYSLAKRFTSAAHLWLGVALALSPICAWLAMRGEEVLQQPLDLLPALGLAAAIATWVAGFDIIYACQDADFDRQAGLHSIPSRLGIAGALRCAAGLHLAMLAILFAIPFAFPQLSLGWLTLTSLAIVAALVVQQHSLVSPTDLGRVNLAFFHINAVISFAFSLTAAIDASLR